MSYHSLRKLVNDLRVSAVLDRDQAKNYPVIPEWLEDRGHANGRAAANEAAASAIMSIIGPDTTAPLSVGNTVRVRIAVAVNESGHWYALGWRAVDPVDSQMAEEFVMDHVKDAVVHWIEADVPTPRPTTIKGEVKEATR